MTSTTASSYRLDPSELESAPVVLLVPWRRRMSLTWAGRRDGKREVRPDPEDGHTPFTRRLVAQICTAVRQEQVRLQIRRSQLGEQLARLAAEAEAQRELRAALRFEEPAPPRVSQPGVPDAVTVSREEEAAAARAGRRRAAELSAVQRLAAIAEETAALDELSHHHERAHDKRVERLRHHGEQLVTVYWRSFARAHPESAELRAGYPIPAIVVPVDVLKHRA